MKLPENFMEFQEAPIGNEKVSSNCPGRIYKKCKGEKEQMKDFADGLAWLGRKLNWKNNCKMEAIQTESFPWIYKCSGKHENF